MSSEQRFKMNSFYGIEVAPSRMEVDLYDAEVIGEIPRELNGALYRVGGDRFYPTLENDNIINGDGLFSMIRFEDGHADFKNRYVRTKRHMAERSARKRLYGLYRNPYTDLPEAPQDDRDNTANTYAFHHHGKLFALREDSLPTEMDPVTLETKETYNFGGKLKSTSVAAHPKLDPVTGEWWSHGLFWNREFEGEMSLEVIDKDGNVVREEFFICPQVGLTHDWAVTRDHVVFDVQPLIVNHEGMKRGEDFYVYDPSKPAMWGIMRRDGSAADMRWFKTKQMTGHIMASYSEGNKVIVDAMMSPGNSFTFFRDIHGAWSPREQSFSTLTRMVFDLDGDSDEPTITEFPGAIGEMPRIDPRYNMDRYRFGFCKSAEGIARVDWDNGIMRQHKTPVGGNSQEALFVPKHADAREGEGYLLSMVNFSAENRAEFYILDAEHIEDEPLARIILPWRQSFSFHGSFVPAESLGW